MAGEQGTRSGDGAPLLLQVATPATALLSAVGFVLAWRAEGEVGWLLVAAAVTAAAGVLSIWFARAGAWLLLVVGGALSALCLFVLATAGGVPWLLIAFWSAMAALLAGLMRLIEGPGEQVRMANVTVLAVLTLLALSALSLGLYVHTEWSEAERTMLEDAPLREYDPRMKYAGALDLSIEAAPGGRWGMFWTDQGRGADMALADMRRDLRREGWRLVTDSREELAAEKSGYRLTVIYEELEPRPVGRGGIGRRRFDVPVLQMAAYMERR